jgi:hypothetical protein
VNHRVRSWCGKRKSQGDKVVGEDVEGAGVEEVGVEGASV